MKAINATDALCRVLYGRGAEPKDYVVRSEARILYDAASEIERLRRQRGELFEQLQKALGKSTRRKSSWWG